VKAKDVMEMSRSNFLDLLKSNGAEDANKKPEAPERDSDDDDEQNKTETSWSALKESYLTDKKLMLKVSQTHIITLFKGTTLGLG
jgi:hypothetical protein